MALATTLFAGAAAAAPQPLSTPTPTPFPTAFFAPRGIGIGRRFENTTVTSSAGPVGPDCGKFDGFKSCSTNGDYGSCLLSSTAASLCNCNDGVQYLDCLSAAIATSSCWGAVGIPDWASYERSWYDDACATPPASVMTQLPQPTTVQVELAPVNIVTPPAGAAVTQPPQQIDPPTYSGAGQLLEGACTSTSYTLVDAGNLVYYAAVVGCGADRPQCCPWNVSTTTNAAAATNTGDPANRVGVAGGPGNFPVPASGVAALLSKCPDDYYSVSGQCCPNGYYKFTAQIAYQTPCYSSLDSVIPITALPPITAGLSANPTDTSKPTSAVLNIALAMAYNVTGGDNPGPLSKGATIGIGIGAGVVAIALGAIAAVCILRMRKQMRASKGLGRGDDDAGSPETTHQQVQVHRELMVQTSRHEGGRGSAGHQGGAGGYKEEYRHQQQPVYENTGPQELPGYDYRR